MVVFPRCLYVFIAVLTTSILYFFSIGLNGFGPLIWIAPIPVLILAFSLSPAQTAVISFAAFLLGSMTLFSYLTRLMPVGMVIASLTIPAIIFTLAVLATRFTVLKFKHWATIVTFPIIWTSYEYLLSIVSPNGTAGSIAYTQADFISLIQIISLTGIWGITFILTVLPTGIAVAWHLRRNKKQAVLSLAVPLTLILLIVVYGLVRLAQPVTGLPLRVGLATTDTTIRYFRTENRDEALAVVQAYTHRINLLSVQGAQVIILPEKIVGVTPDYASGVYRILGEIAKNNHVTIIVGLNFISSEHSQNKAVVFSPSGKVLAEYCKIHLVPGFEAHYLPGSEPVEFSLLEMKAGLAICKDMDFSWPASQYARDGVGIVFVPAWDFGQDGQFHARMAIMRGIEGGFAVIRSAQDGLVTVSDHHGRIISEGRSSQAPDVLLVTEIKPGLGHTFYSVCGDWVAWLCLLSLVLIPTIASLSKLKDTTSKT